METEWNRRILTSRKGLVLDGGVHALVAGHLALKLIHEEGGEDADNAEDDQHLRNGLRHHVGMY